MVVFARYSVSTTSTTEATTTTPMVTTTTTVTSTTPMTTTVATTTTPLVTTTTIATTTTPVVTTKSTTTTTSVDETTTNSNPSGYLTILNTEDGWYLREDGVYQSPASWEYSSTNIGSEWIGKTIAEYCAAQGTSGITFTDPWYCTRFMNVERWGDYVIGSRKLTTVTYEGCTVDVKMPF